MRIEDFKYPIYRLFFDCDGIACTFVEDMALAYPQLKDEFEEISWNIDRLSPIAETYNVVAIEDALQIIYASESGLGLVSEFDTN